jgi:hypothetical protein
VCANLGHDTRRFPPIFHIQRQRYVYKYTLTWSTQTWEPFAAISMLCASTNLLWATCDRACPLDRDLSSSIKQHISHLSKLWSRRVHVVAPCCSIANVHMTRRKDSKRHTLHMLCSRVLHISLGLETFAPIALLLRLMLHQSMIYQ